jgi:hypothetical protein
MNETEYEVYCALIQVVERFGDANFAKLSYEEQREFNRITIMVDLLSPSSINNGTDEELALDLAYVEAYGQRRPKPNVPSFREGLLNLGR